MLPPCAKIAGGMKFWIGEHIRQARVRKKITQTCLGSIIGCGQSYICNMERGKIDPGFHEILKLLHFLDTPIPPLVDGLRPDRPPSA